MSIWVAALIFAAAVGVDQLLKYFAVTVWAQTPVSVIDGVFEFVYLENRGVAFGMFSGSNANTLFIILTSVVMAVVVVAALKMPMLRTKSARLLCTLVVAGGIGNLIDRIFRGYVVDFAYFRLINFPVFNFADACITCGAIALAAVLLFGKQPAADSEGEPDSDLSQTDKDGK